MAGGLLAECKAHYYLPSQVYVTEATQFCVTAGSTLIFKSVQSRELGQSNKEVNICFCEGWSQLHCLGDMNLLPGQMIIFSRIFGQVA